MRGKHKFTKIQINGIEYISRGGKALVKTLGVTIVPQLMLKVCLYLARLQKAKYRNQCRVRNAQIMQALC